MPIPEHDAWIYLAPARPIWFFAVISTSGFTCCTFHDEPRIRASEAYPSRMVRQTYPSAPLALRRRFRPSRPSPRLLWPLLTSRSGFHRRPFRHEARSPQVRTHSFPAQPPDLRRLILDHKSFAVFGPLALIGTAFYPVLVHRLAGSLHASFPRSVALPQLRFASLTVVSSRRDFHPQECAHAGRTQIKNPLGERIFYYSRSFDRLRQGRQSRTLAMPGAATRADFSGMFNNPDSSLPQRQDLSQPVSQFQPWPCFSKHRYRHSFPAAQVYLRFAVAVPCAAHHPRLPAARSC